jgi:hypothetical protein
MDESPKSLIAQVKESYAEQWGFTCRQANDARETNPYANLKLKEPGNIAKMKPLAQAWWRGWDRANAILNRSHNKPVEFWLWWFTDGSGRRRRTPYRMSREVALQRYPDAEPVAGTMEMRSIGKRRRAATRRQRA